MTIIEQHQREIVRQQYEQEIASDQSAVVATSPAEMVLTDFKVSPAVVHSLQASFERPAESLLYETPLDLPAVPLNQTSVIEILPEALNTQEPMVVEQDTLAKISLTNELEVREEHLPHMREHTHNPPDSEDFAAELSKEPDEIYEDFTRALMDMAINLELTGNDEELGENGDASEKFGEPSMMAEVAALVITQLAELKAEDSPEITVLLKDIVGALHGLALLEEQGTNVELAGLVQDKLRELSTELLTRLGIEASEHNVEYLVRAIQHPRFGAALLTQQAVEHMDIDHNGTHEAKYYARVLSATNNSKTYAHQALGMFTLFCAGLHTARTAV